MKNSFLYFLPAFLLITACKENEATGEIQPTWLFWVFLGLIAFGLIAGVFTAQRKNAQKDQQQIDKTEQQIEKFEETLEKKAERENRDAENNKDADKNE